MAEKATIETDPHEGHPEAGYREEDIGKEMKKHRGDVGTLIELLKSKYQLDREKAADYLGEIGDPRAVPALIEALKDPAISWIAAESLGKLGDPRAVPPLIAALGSDEKWLRRNAATALGRIGDPAAAGPLTTLLSDGKDNVRQAAASALGMIGIKESVASLQILAKDPDENVRQAASASIGQIERKNRKPSSERGAGKTGD